MRSYASDRRTPLAWRHRDMTLHGAHHHHHHHHGSHHPRHHHHHRHRSPPSPSITTSSAASSSDEVREEVPMVRAQPLRRPNSRSYGAQFSPAPEQQHHQHHQHHPFRSGGTLRSTRSVPALALATWDGEPCPVHGHGMPPPLFHGATLRRHSGSLFDVRGPPTLPPPPPLLDKKSFHGSMQLLGGMGPNPWMAPPLMRPRPFVIPAGAEPLPVRDPFRRGGGGPPAGYAPSKMADDPDYDQVCCKGHLIVLWIILGVVTVGVILGIVLGVTIA